MIKKSVILWILALVISCFTGCVDGGNIEDNSTDSSALKPIVTDGNPDTDDMTNGNDGNATDGTDAVGEDPNGDNGIGSGEIQVPGNGNGDGNLNGSGNGTGNDAGNGGKSAPAR